MKLRIEISDDRSDDTPDEVIIRCKSITDEVRRLQNAFNSALKGSELALTSGNTEYFIPVNDILFFETDGTSGSGHVSAHTKDSMYYSELKLYELEAMLPGYFARISKSCIVNSSKIVSLGRNVTGTAEALFAGTPKKVYVSRMYYKVLKNLIYETRLSKPSH